ncbi:conserved hypothetical protein [Burkholderia cenocepacia]|nr:conserved hypothetical protein [Burkholderia cenocepacia]
MPKPALRKQAGFLLSGGPGMWLARAAQLRYANGDAIARSPRRATRNRSSSTRRRHAANIA